MNAKQSPSAARTATIVGLIVGAVGILILRLAGVAMPVVPPGLVMLVVAAVFVAVAPWRWAPVVAIVAGLAEVAGFFASGSADGLFEIGSLGVLAGTWVRLAGILTAVVAGVLATRIARRTAAGTVPGSAGAH